MGGGGRGKTNILQRTIRVIICKILCYHMYTLTLTLQRVTFMGSFLLSPTFQALDCIAVLRLFMAKRVKLRSKA